MRLIRQVLLILLLTWLFAAQVQATVIFQTSFDSDDNWTHAQTSSDYVCYSGCSLPTGWTAIRDGLSYCSVNGYDGPGNNTMSLGTGIVGSESGTIDATGCSGGSGKCVTFWDESCDNSFEDSDGMLGVDLGSEYEDIYLGYDVRYSPDYVIEAVTGEDTAQHKYDHIQHYASGNPFAYLESGPNNQPVSSAGYMRYQNSFLYISGNRCTNDYWCASGADQNVTVSSYATAKSTGILNGSWHRIVLRQKRNSSIGATDGIHQAWYDGVQIMSLTNLTTNDTGSAELRGFRFVAIGGNNNNRWTTSCSGTSCEQWYAIDNVVIATTYDEAATYSEGEEDTTAPTVTADDSTKAISADSYTAEGDASDAVGVSSCKWRLGSSPDADNGTACTGTTAWSCSTSGYSEGSNTLYVGCADAAGNWGTDTVTVTYTIPAAATAVMTGGTCTGCTIR